MTVFVDTVALIALTVRSDRWNARAREVQASLAAEKAPLVTSDWVLTEFLNAGARTPELPSAAAAVVQRLRASPRTTIGAATRDDWLRAFDLYRSRGDKGGSLVDCSSILICEAIGIERVFTHDRRFEQAGFRVLLG